MNMMKRWRIRLKWRIRSLRKKRKERKATAKQKKSAKQMPQTETVGQPNPKAESDRKQRSRELTLLILRILPNLLILLPKLWNQIKRLIQSWNTSGES